MLLAPALPTSPRHVLLTGVTGFVGQAVLERLLSCSEAHISVLVRSRGQVDAATRLARLLDKPVFGPWRERLGEPGARREIARRVHLLPGDLDDVPDLPADLDLVVHSASCVSFDEPVDRAFASNVGGAAELYAALAAAGADPHVVHVSTGYVSTGRTGLANEGPVPHEVSWRGQLARATRAGERVTERVAAGELSASEATTRLRELGRRWAQDLGWTDVYTMTKALGERVAEEMWAGRGHRLTVLRPTIIESARRYPFPGWIDGFKVADPLIAAYARGDVARFPGEPACVFDIVPVDVVVSAALAAPVLPAGAEPHYLHVGTGTSNPLTLGALAGIVEDYFARHPWVDRHGQVVRPEPWAFREPGRFHADLGRRRAALRTVDRTLGRLPGRFGTATRRRAALALRRMGTLERFVGLFEPYTTIDTRFDDATTRRLVARLGRLGDHDLDVTTLDWRRYLTETHLPALVRLMDTRHGATPRPPVTTLHPQTGSDAAAGRPVPAGRHRGAASAVVRADSHAPHAPVRRSA